MKRNILFDCDPGLDDALALLLAVAQKDWHILGITTIAGNSLIEDTTQNALDLLEYYGRGDIPVAKGSSNPILGRFASGSHVHGSTGIANITLPKAKREIEALRAHEWIAKTLDASTEKVTIIATGPLTNVGMAISLYPEILDKIEMISLMGGSVNVGNVGAVMEANIKNDPEAAHIVFNSGVKLVMFGLNVTYQTVIYPYEMDAIARLGKFGALAADCLRHHFKNYQELPFFKGDPSHDSCAVAYLIKPELFTLEQLNVVVDLSGTYSRGQTIVDQHGVTGRPLNAWVALASDREGFVALIKDAVQQLNQA